MTADDDTPENSQLESERRLLAMAITRAKKAVIVGYKPGEESQLVGFFRTGTFKTVDL